MEEWTKDTREEEEVAAARERGEEEAAGRGARARGRWQPGAARPA